jgi:hypothetical protein
MRGLRKIAPKKPPKVREGLDDAAHRQRVKALPCVLRGKRCHITRWVGVYPNKREVTEEYQHICIGPVDPHHVIYKSQRGSDFTVVPLCRGAHDEAHKLGTEGFRLRWGIALPVVAASLAPKKG